MEAPCLSYSISLAGSDNPTLLLRILQRPSDAARVHTPLQTYVMVCQFFFRVDRKEHTQRSNYAQELACYFGDGFPKGDSPGYPSLPGGLS